MPDRVIYERTSPPARGTRIEPSPAMQPIVQKELRHMQPGSRATGSRPPGPARFTLATDLHRRFTCSDWNLPYSWLNVWRKSPPLVSCLRSLRSTGRSSRRRPDAGRCGQVQGGSSRADARPHGVARSTFRRSSAGHRILVQYVCARPLQTGTTGTQSTHATLLVQEWRSAGCPGAKGMTPARTRYPSGGSDES